MAVDLLKVDSQRASPLILAAAVALIVVGAVSIGALTGVIPSTFSDAEENTQPAAAPVIPVKPAAGTCYTCGTIASIRAVELRQPQGPAAKDAPGERDTASAILRAAGGIFGGQEFEKTVGKRYAYRVTIRMDDGSYRTVSETSPPKFAIGEKVRLIDGTLAARS
ncbi:MAG: hypothetical protein A2W04_10220 [Betaproteobacteria bacterium RBG_16_64_9]|nr:MAG: hypothetical protein A2W04_10220 [Betaproteobacteria bacterium RBG_16_64_9]